MSNFIRACERIKGLTVISDVTYTQAVARYVQTQQNGDDKLDRMIAQSTVAFVAWRDDLTWYHPSETDDQTLATILQARADCQQHYRAVRHDKERIKSGIALGSLFPKFGSACLDLAKAMPRSALKSRLTLWARGAHPNCIGMVAERPLLLDALILDSKQNNEQLPAFREALDVLLFGEKAHTNRNMLYRRLLLWKYTPPRPLQALWQYGEALQALKRDVG